MKKTLHFAFLIATFLLAQRLQAREVSWSALSAGNAPAAEPALKPRVYALFRVSEPLLGNALAAAPQSAEAADIIALPTPEGGFRDFRVWQTPVMDKALAARYPGIYTLTAVAADDPSVSAKLDFSPAGFRAMVWSRQGVYFVDPYNAADAPGFYMAYYRRDFSRSANQYMHCESTDDALPGTGEDELTWAGTGVPAYRVNGALRKTYRLALACTEEYAAAVGGPSPTKASVLAKMVISVNRVNGVYERELAVTLTLIANTDTLIFLPGSGDPYTNNSGSTMLGQNQTTINARIGAVNYDIGHVFSTGGGGIAQLGCVCNSGAKAMGVTGSSSPVGDPFDIDYVAHEMGHQFSGQHTFNSNLGSCNGNRSATSAYEPGSGTTIMAYAGICLADDVQAHSDPFFHVRSLQQISTFITTGGGAACPVTAPTGNVPPVLPPIATLYSIPFLTPFELTAPVATDADHDTLTYLWEQWDRGGSTVVQQAKQINTPTFRSFVPSADRTRVFPVITKLVNNVTNYKGELLPDTSRRLTFKLTCRDILNGIGSFNYTDDTVAIDVVHTGTPFAVTAPNTGINLTANQNTTVTWDVSNTTAAPISSPNVSIYLSTDGGFTYPILLVANTPNDGSEVVMMPNINTTKARVKVKSANNIFFDISNTNFILSGGVGVRNSALLDDAVRVFPVPADDELHIASTAGRELDLRLSNAVGQTVGSAALTSLQATMATGHLAPGVYFLHILDTRSGESTVKRVTLR